MNVPIHFICEVSEVEGESPSGKKRHAGRQKRSSAIPGRLFHFRPGSVMAAKAMPNAARPPGMNEYFDVGIQNQKNCGSPCSSAMSMSRDVPSYTVLQSWGRRNCKSRLANAQKSPAKGCRSKAWNISNVSSSERFSQEALKLEFRPDPPGHRGSAAPPFLGLLGTVWGA